MVRGEEKLAVVTGASRGLGLAMAEGFLARGWRVAGCARSGEAFQALRERAGLAGLFEVADVTDGAAVERFASRVLDTFGPPDLLLSNAALINANAPLWEVPPGEFSRVIDVNLKGVHLVLRAFLPAMIERRRGVVVNFSSGWGRSTSPEVAPYCATKWGVEGLTAALAQELPRGLAAVALNPGVIDTEMLRSCFGEGAGAYPDPTAWAKSAVPFLASLGPEHNGQALTAP
jgi:NAD(P)-dependent dehydrogenase (short-subunit alcohol dehydrogenase family)